MQYSFESTSDGRFGLSGFGDPPVVIDLETGSSTPMPGALTVLGRWIVVGTFSEGAFVPDQVDLVDPQTGSVVGGSRDPAVTDELSARTFGAVDTHVSVSSDDRIAVMYVRTPDTTVFAVDLDTGLDGRQIDFEPTITACPERVGDVLVAEQHAGGRRVLALDQVQE